MNIQRPQRFPPSALPAGEGQGRGLGTVGSAGTAGLGALVVPALCWAAPGQVCGHCWDRDSPGAHLGEAGQLLGKVRSCSEQLCILNPLHFLHFFAFLCILCILCILYPSSSSGILPPLPAPWHCPSPPLLPPQPHLIWIFFSYSTAPSLHS